MCPGTKVLNALQTQMKAHYAKQGKNKIKIKVTFYPTFFPTTDPSSYSLPILTNFRDSQWFWGGA